jgi:thiol:disulfide interchange protein DsbD
MPGGLRGLAAALFSLFLLAGLAPAARAHAGDGVPEDGAELVHAELLAEADALVPGQPAWLGVRLVHAPHWHTYWVNPGDAGLPTRLQWQLPPGFSAGPVQWPLPALLPAGDLANYGYEGTVLLPVRVQVPPASQAGHADHVRLAVRADWLVCRDMCIPGGADLTLDLPLRSSAHAGPQAAAFASARAQVPQGHAPAGLQAERRGTRVALSFADQGLPAGSLAFYASEGGVLQAAPDQSFTHAQGRGRLLLTLADPPPPSLARLSGLLVQTTARGGAPAWAAPIEVAVRTGSGSFAVPPASQPSAAGAPSPTPGMPSGVTAGVTAGAAAPSAAASAPTSGAGTLPAQAAGAGGAAPQDAAGAAPGMGLALLGAFVGGLILNLMPCVFPVLSLKILSLVGQKERSHLPAHGLAYSAGVLASFLGLAGLLLVLRGAGSQIGWGFQLQSPAVVAALLALFFLIGLNLLGAFEFVLGSGLANSRVAEQAAGAGGLRASFVTGVLAAVVASPCTAPFMGAALGFALTQPAPLSLAVFAALGSGMAAPYLVLTLSPALARRLPRPGAWMERLRQGFAFPMFLTGVWLFWVLAQQVPAGALALLMAGLVALGMAAWAWGLAQRGARSLRWLALVALLAAGAAGAGFWREQDEAAAAELAATAATPEDGAVGAVPEAEGRTAGAASIAGARTAGMSAAWSPALQAQALARGEPLLVDFTAAWCITCQANKRLVLRDARVAQAMQEHGVRFVEADWTRRDANITRELARFARSGVPLYVLYDRHGTARVLPEILSVDGVLAALASV